MLTESLTPCNCLTIPVFEMSASCFHTCSQSLDEALDRAQIVSADFLYCLQSCLKLSDVLRLHVRTVECFRHVSTPNSHQQWTAVWVKKSPLKMSDIFPKPLGIFSPNFTRLLYVPIYARLQIFIQSPATLTKLCHIKHDHHHAQNVHHLPKHSLGGRT